MSETDSTLEPGTQAANPAASGSAVQPNSFDPEKFAKDLTAKILAQINDPRTIQSQKDRVIAEVKKDKGLKEVFAEIEAMRSEGLTDAEIKREIRLRDLEARTAAEAASAPQSSGKVVVPAANDAVKALISSLELDLNSAEVVNILTGQDSLEDKLTAVAGIVKAKNKPFNPALVAQPAGGGIPPANPALLAAQYKQEVMANRGNKATIKLIQQKYAEQGLDISGVGFSV